MFVFKFLKQFIKYGTLTLIDNRGKTFTFVGTPSPKLTIRLHNKSIEHRLFQTPMLALGEGYMDGDITIKEGDIYQLLLFCAKNDNCTSGLLKTLISRLATLRNIYHRCNPIHKSRKNVAHHYDLSESLYRLFLDEDMQYSCAYFKTLEDDLETAQVNKKRHIAAKLLLKPGQRVLDIGCGWGGLTLTLAQEWDVDVTGLTLSEEQHRVATERVKQAGLEKRVRFLLRDYRHETGSYDRIVSVGMFEHVGLKHYHEFFSKVSSLLAPDGIALLHSIGYSKGPDIPNPWLNKYIFPGGYAPALSETLATIEPTDLTVTDIEILHHHYAETLRHWREKCATKQEIIISSWGERFYRMWEFYLASCEVAFLTRGFMVFQIQMFKNPELAPLTRNYIQQEEENFLTDGILYKNKVRSVKRI
ncbi:cyclopropane-fatty-acyl-phospholipid synthase family protein [Kamptonema cortianum]|nr:cyclopropane-fatty-acyl-phospholipid synthase family protein [Geitlerinema splendidum]MDK3161376.1 cyclopropane-fatty-acyl-phospholipid synthase family protein [Kamptonema cortianum]